MNSLVLLIEISGLTVNFPNLIKQKRVRQKDDCKLFYYVPPPFLKTGVITLSNSLWILIFIVV